MLKNIQIIEKSSGHIVAQYPIVEIADASEKEYCEDAWENAVDEGLVEEYSRDNYDIEIVEDIPPE